MDLTALHCVAILQIVVLISGEDGNRENVTLPNEHNKSVELGPGVNGSGLSAPTIVRVEFKNTGTTKTNEGNTQSRGNAAKLVEKKIGFSERLTEMVVIKMENMFHEFFDDSGFVNIVQKTSEVVRSMEKLFKRHTDVITERNNNDILLSILMSNVTKKLKKVMRTEKIILNSLGPTGDRVLDYLGTMSQDILFLKDVAKLTLDCKFGVKNRRKKTE